MASKRKDHRTPLYYRMVQLLEAGLDNDTAAGVMDEVYRSPGFDEAAFARKLVQAGRTALDKKKNENT